MVPALPLKSVVLFIAVGTMVFIIVFIFAKRQITRFALKSRGPHVAIGSDAPKSLRQEIERRLKRTGEIRCEPRLLANSEESEQKPLLNGEMPHFYYRMKAVDAVLLLDEELRKYSVHIRRRVGQHALRLFLLELRQNGPLEGLQLEVIEKFTETYDHARHDPAEFVKEHYTEHMGLLNQMIEHIRNQKNRKGKVSSVAEPLVIDEDPSSNTTSAVKVSTSPEKSPQKSIPESQRDTSGKDTIAAEVNKSTEDIPITYRPATKDRSGGVLQFVPGHAKSGSESSHATGSDAASSQRSSHASDNVETCV